MSHWTTSVLVTGLDDSNYSHLQVQFNHFQFEHETVCISHSGRSPFGLCSDIVKAMKDHSSETNVMEIDWDLEHFMSQVDLDDAEDFKLTDILKEFRFLPPVDNEKKRVPKSTRKATHVSPLSSDSTEQCNIAAKLSLDTPVSISFVKGDMRFELRF